MTLSMAKLIAVIGIFLIFAGLRLLWQARRGFFYWIETYLRLFVRLLREPEAKHQPFRLQRPQSGERNTLRLVIGMFLVFLLGPALIALGLTL